MGFTESVVVMKRNFKGKGSMAGFVDSSNRVFAALSNMEVKVPPGFDGAEPVLKLRESDDSASFEFNMNDAIMLNTDAAVVSINGSATSSFTLSVSNGRLIIDVA